MKLKKSRILNILILFFMLVSIGTQSFLFNFNSRFRNNLIFQNNSLFSVPPEAFLSTRQLVEQSGSKYELEDHKVTTPDGYILTLYKIVGNSNSSKNSTLLSKEPVLILHGFLCSSDDWFLTEPASDNLPYTLVDRGHEVWLGNFRGNRYSSGHVNFSQDDLKYWDFSYDELGLYDVPSLIEYILIKSNQDKLSYVGFSLGTTSFFIAMDRHPHLQSKVKKMLALAPAAYGSNTKIIWKNFSRIPSDLLLKTASLMVGHLFSQSSAKTLVHMFQLIRKPQFQAYDYGESGNLKFYNKSEPPIYDLSKIQVPIKALYGLNDPMVVPQDALRTIRELGNIVESGPVNFSQWTHLDFVYGRDVRSLVFDQCIQFLEN